MKKLEHAVKLERFVSMSEFARQGPRELARQNADSVKFEFEIWDDRVVISQIDPFLVSGAGAPAISMDLARAVLTVNNDYTYDCTGRSRVQELEALDMNAKHEKATKERSEAALAEAGGDARELLEWAINKDSGNGIHISRS